MTQHFTTLPPSALLVYRVLDEEGPLTQKQLVDESMLCPRTCRYALRRLDDVGILERRPNPADARQTLYSLAEDVSRKE